MNQQVCQAIHRVCTVTVIHSHAAEGHSDSHLHTRLLLKRNALPQHLFVQQTMVLFTNWVSERIVVAASGVMVLDAKHTGRDCQSAPLTLLAVVGTSCRPNWVLISHTTLFKWRYKAKSDKTDSIEVSTFKSVTSSTPAIFLPFHFERTPRLPRKARPTSRR
jgi:hypothetical protein